MMLLFVVVVVGNKLMPTKALFYHWKHGSLGGTKSRVWFLPLSNPTVRYIAFCNDTSPARLGWPQICPGLKKKGHMDTNPAHLGNKYFFAWLGFKYFFSGDLARFGLKYGLDRRKKGGSAINWNFFLYYKQTAANNWLGFTAGLATFDF